MDLPISYHGRMALEPLVGETHPDRRQGVAALALLSLAAGFLHAAVIDSHRGHGISAGVFAGMALFQIVWAGVVMAKASRVVLVVGAVANAAFLVGWVVSRTSGIGLVSGFEDAESVRLTDSVVAGMEALVVVGAVVLAVALPARRLWPAGRLGSAVLASVGLVVAAVGVPAAADANSYVHNGHPEGSEAGGEGGEVAAAAHGDHASGVPGAVESTVATPEQEAAAEALLTDTIEGLWQWTDPDRTYAAGFRTIGDGPTGTEHLVNWNWINDDVVLDPDAPEALVFRVTPDGARVLEAAMFMAPAGTPAEEIPDIGGPITQWHVHDNLCYAPVEMIDGAPSRRVIGITSADGTCTAGEHPEPEAPMLHVWVVPRACGPFSSLEGVGAGQGVEEVEDPATDPACQQST